MIVLTKQSSSPCTMEFVRKGDPRIGQFGAGAARIFDGDYLKVLPLPQGDRTVFLVGCGEPGTPTVLAIKEILAAGAARCRSLGVPTCAVDLTPFAQALGADGVTAAVLGLGLGGYPYGWGKQLEDTPDCEFQVRLPEGYEQPWAEGLELLQGVKFARHLVNAPGNLLRPEAFAREILRYVADQPIETQVLPYEQLCKMGMNALVGIGESSAFLPRLVVLRYRGAPESDEVYGLIGKGITCDTGGYCLKGADTMGGIKGDMAGAAAVTAAIRAAAVMGLHVNITVCLPLAENRISRASLLPGDVITGYSGKTIEVLNTDAEGRLVLSDAISYAIRDEGVTKILDIATLTGAVANMLGNTIAGALSDNDEYYSLLERALPHSGERYLRIPYGPEHERMIDTKMADVRNTGVGYCGTITAGLFLHRFCEGRPWIHLDIAGAAWCGKPTYAFEDEGATGAAVTTLYYMMKEAEAQQ